MTKSTRRDILRVSAAAIAGVTGGTLATPSTIRAGENSEHRTAECNFGHTILFMDEYYRGTIEILGRLHGEVEHVAELSARAARVIRSGGTVWTSMDTGHLPHYEHEAQRRGNPGI